MANDDRDQRREHAPPSSVVAQLARPNRLRTGTPVDGTPIDQMAYRIKRASDTTLPDIQSRVAQLEAGHVTMIRDIGEVKVTAAEISGAIGGLGVEVAALMKSAEAEAAEQAKAREAARAERAARAARAATAAEANRDRLTKVQLALIAVLPAILAAILAYLAARK